MKWRTFNPTPPAFRLSMNTFGFREGLLNSAMVWWRFFISVDPSSRYHSKLSRWRAISIKSRKLVNWEKTTARKQGSWSWSRPRYFALTHWHLSTTKKLTKILHESIQLGRALEVVLPYRESNTVWLALLRRPLLRLDPHTRLSYSLPVLYDFEKLVLNNRSLSACWTMAFFAFFWQLQKVCQNTVLAAVKTSLNILALMANPFERTIDENILEWS